jgi:hypothetical protein
LSVLAAAIASGSSNSTLNDVEPGLLGFLIVAGMGLILVFLLKNMNKQFKKLPPPEESDPESASGEADEDGQDIPAGQVIPGQVVAAETAPDTVLANTVQANSAQPDAVQAGKVQTGNAKLDEQAQGITKRK